SQTESHAARAVENAVTLHDGVAASRPEVNAVLGKTLRAEEALDDVVVDAPPARPVRVDPTRVAIVANHRSTRRAELYERAGHDTIVVVVRLRAVEIDLDPLLESVADMNVEDRCSHGVLGIGRLDVDGVGVGTGDGKIGDSDVAPGDGD